MLIVIVLVLLYFPADALSLAPSNFRIKICQNKDCCKRFPFTAGEGGLPLIILDLLPQSDIKVEIERSGCLNQCKSGPNVIIFDENGDESLHKSVSDSVNAAVMLQSSGVLGKDASINPILLGAVDVIYRATCASSLEKRENLLNSVIKKLSLSDGLKESNAMAHALMLRADTRLEMIPLNLDGALQDSKCASEMRVEGFEGMAWRIRADAEEASGNILGAIDAMENWAKENPTFISKVKKEVVRLSKSIPISD
mmetsp:Transcript_18582/g.26154  ORF Transcript_18582/g.26154 Transcript_18582/m.26154 type:complete len:254 (-) Transcript_18582:180-941(-)